MHPHRAFLAQETELGRLERLARKRPLTDAEADIYAELMYRAQRCGFRLYHRRAGATAFARRRERNS